jgi:hypothetical protein
VGRLLMGVSEGAFRDFPDLAGDPPPNPPEIVDH